MTIAPVKTVQRGPGLRWVGPYIYDSSSCKDRAERAGLKVGRTLYL